MNWTPCFLRLLATSVAPSTSAMSSLPVRLGPKIAPPEAGVKPRGIRGSGAGDDQNLGRGVELPAPPGKKSRGQEPPRPDPDQLHGDVVRTAALVRQRYQPLAGS